MNTLGKTSLLLCFAFVSHLYAQPPSQSADSVTAVENKHCDKVYLQILGEGGPEINDGLASSSYLVWINNKARILIDAGGGSSLKFEQSLADFNDLQAILLSHLHVDHSAALAVYLKGSFFTGRQNNLPLFGPAGGGDFPSTSAFISALVSDKQASVYPYLSDTLIDKPNSNYVIMPQNISLGISNHKVWSKNLSPSLTISAITVNHGAIPALAWRIDSNKCSVTFSGDMNGSSDNLITLAKNTNILVAHNAIPEQASSIAKYLHMTPSRIGEIAHQAQAKKLVLSHFMQRTINNKKQTKALIRQSYQGEIIEAKALMKIDL